MMAYAKCISDILQCMRHHRASLDTLEVFESAARYLSFIQAAGWRRLTDTGP